MDRFPHRERFRPDWPAIEIDDRAGELSLRDMAIKHRCATSTIANKARREGWPRRDRCLHGMAVVQQRQPAGNADDATRPPEVGSLCGSISAALRPGLAAIRDDLD